MLTRGNGLVIGCGYLFKVNRVLIRGQGGSLGLFVGQLFLYYVLTLTSYMLKVS